MRSARVSPIVNKIDWQLFSFNKKRFQSFCLLNLLLRRCAVSPFRHFLSKLQYAFFVQFSALNTNCEVTEILKTFLLKLVVIILKNETVNVMKFINKKFKNLVEVSFNKFYCKKKYLIMWFHVY